MIKFVPIEIPPEPEWNEEMDDEYAESIVEEAELARILFRVFFYSRELSTALRKAIEHIKKDGLKGKVSGIPDLVDRLEQVYRKAKPGLVPEHVAEKLKYVRFAHSEWQRVMSRYHADATLCWKTPLVMLGDELMAAQQYVVEIMFNEFDARESQFRLNICW